MSKKLNSTLVTIDAANIEGWTSFHAVFKNALGFPEYYGANMDAWNDCMTCVDDPQAAMTGVHAPEGGVLIIQLKNAKAFKTRCQEIYDALIECSAFVNFRRIEKGEAPVLMLSFYD